MNLDEARARSAPPMIHDELFELVLHGPAGGEFVHPLPL
jgi:hypothetical protein